ncbi:MAG: ribose 5-phosphate isomerase B [bacterium]
MAGTAKILILGAGFGGLFAALGAHRALRDSAEITLIDRNDYFLFTPLLHEVVSGTLRPHHVARPLARLLPRGLRFVRATVEGVDLADRRVETDAGALPYDFLVLALGGVPNFFGQASVERNALPFKWLPDALRLRAQIEQRFAEAERDARRAPELLRTIIAGAGCTGVELVTELYDWMRGPMLRQHRRVRAEAVTFVLAEALDHLLCPMDPRLMRAAVRQLVTRHIEMRLAHYVTEVAPGSVRFRTPSGEEAEMPCGTAIWTAGIKAHPVVAALAVPKGSGGRVQVSQTLQIPGYPEVLVLGDCAACPEPGGAILPATAQVAVQQAAVTPRILRALLAGREPAPFRFRRKGEVVALGRLGALAEVFGFGIMGLPGWLIARTIHLARLPDWGDRVAVAWEWAKDLVRGEGRILTKGEAMRIAIGSDHAGVTLKEDIAAYVAELGHAVLDLGTHGVDPVDYPDYAAAVGHAVVGGQAERGILLCGSGVGASVAANKIPGIRAGLCHDTYSAHQGVEHDDMNVLVMGARVIGPASARELVRAFLGAQFSGEERHLRRLAKVEALEARGTR